MWIQHPFWHLCLYPSLLERISNICETQWVRTISFLKIPAVKRRAGFWKIGWTSVCWSVWRHSRPSGDSKTKPFYCETSPGRISFYRMRMEVINACCTLKRLWIPAVKLFVQVCFIQRPPCQGDQGPHFSANCQAPVHGAQWKALRTWDRSMQTMACEPTPASCLTCYSLQFKNGFYIFICHVSTCIIDSIFPLGPQRLKHLLLGPLR